MSQIHAALADAEIASRRLVEARGRIFPGSGAPTNLSTLGEFRDALRQLREAHECVDQMRPSGTLSPTNQ
jgi:hypothetical protein